MPQCPKNLEDLYLDYAKVMNLTTGCCGGLILLAFAFRYVEQFYPGAELLAKITVVAGLGIMVIGWVSLIRPAKLAADAFANAGADEIAELLPKYGKRPTFRQFLRIRNRILSEGDGQDR